MDVDDNADAKISSAKSTAGQSLLRGKALDEIAHLQQRFAVAVLAG